MVEYARRAQGDWDLEDRLQETQHPLRQSELDSSSLPVVSDRSIHIVLKNTYISTCSCRNKHKLSNILRDKQEEKIG